METTGKALVEHWNWAAEKGEMNANTAAGLRSACTKVLGVLPDWETTDIKTVDVEKVLTQFQNLEKKAFKPAVLETYKRRFRQAVSSYLRYLEDPGNWKATMVVRAPRPGRAAADAQGEAAEAVVTTRGAIPASGLVDYPFPLREGQIVRLVLPRDLKATEVKRLSAFMSALVLDADSATAST